MNYRRAVQAIRYDHAVSVTTSAYTELDSSLNQDTEELEIFDSSGSVLQLATGAAGSEVVLPFYIMPGGNANRVCFKITRGTRLSVKAIDTATTDGQLILNCFA